MRYSSYDEAPVLWIQINWLSNDLPRFEGSGKLNMQMSMQDAFLSKAKDMFDFTVVYHYKCSKDVCSRDKP
jgi:hypothetical protein